MTTPTRKERIMGAVLGALVGDALGVGPHWYYDLAELRRDYGEWIESYAAPRPGRYHEGLGPGDSSQTGQVARLLLASVAESGGYDEADFTGRLDGLLQGLDGTPRSGRYTDQAMRDVWRARRAGIAWPDAGSFADTGEAAMRGVVLAGRFGHHFPALVDSLYFNARLTHRDPYIAGVSVAFGLVVAQLIEGTPLRDAPDAIRRRAARAQVELDVPVSTRAPSEAFGEAPGETAGEAACDAPGETVGETAGEAPDGTSGRIGFMDAVLLPGWVAEAATDPNARIVPAHAVCRLYGLSCALPSLYPTALYLAARFPADFEAAVLHAVNGGGNNMARAALTGALAGAAVGLGGIPRRFLDGLEDAGSALAQAERLADDALAGG